MLRYRLQNELKKRTREDSDHTLGSEDTYSDLEDDKGEDDDDETLTFDSNATTITTPLFIPLTPSPLMLPGRRQPRSTQRREERRHKRRQTSQTYIPRQRRFNRKLEFPS